MANLEIEGRISHKLPVQSGQSSRGAWKKQDFVLDYQDGNYPAQAMFTAFGNNNVAELDKYSIGDEVRVSFNIKAREYNGRWYNDVRIWKIVPAGQAAAPTSPEEAPAPSIEDMPEPSESSESEDLPF